MRLNDALEMVALSDPGVIRSHNEDATFSDASLGIAILADGMGGYNAGEVASSMAVARLSSNWPASSAPACRKPAWGGAMQRSSSAIL